MSFYVTGQDKVGGATVYRLEVFLQVDSEVPVIENFSLVHLLYLKMFQFAGIVDICWFWICLHLTLTNLEGQHP